MQCFARISFFNKNCLFHFLLWDSLVFCQSIFVNLISYIDVFGILSLSYLEFGMMLLVPVIVHIVFGIVFLVFGILYLVSRMRYKVFVSL